MFKLKSIKTLITLCGAAVIWTSCQKETSNSHEQPTTTTTENKSGVAPDNPNRENNVSVIMSTEFAEQAGIAGRRGGKDFDRDGIPDSHDACITQKETYNGYQDQDGCPDTVPGPVDTDNDGIADANDACPTQAETMNGYLDTDGCPDTVPGATDTDHDGIPDQNDACPTQPETANGYQDQDGCPDTVPAPTDTDQDGIPDQNDGCPTQPETVNGYLDTDGCPDTPPSTPDTTIITPPPGSLPSSHTIYMPPVGNQGSEGSCVSWAVSYARSADQFFRTGASSYNQSTNITSPEFLFNQTKLDASCGSSAMMTALDFLKNSGICTWQSMPYSSSNGCSLLPNSQQSSEALQYRIASYSKVYTSDITALKQLLAANRPLLTSFSIDGNFRYAQPGYIWSSFSGSAAALHAVAIVGYDDSKNAIKIINSWGTGWADQGYLWIDYNFFKTNLASFVYVMNY